MSSDSCFNCGSTDCVQAYSFDMDLPAIVSCQTCIFALSMGDDDLLKALRPRKMKRKAKA